MHGYTSESMPAAHTITRRRSWRRTVADALALAHSAVELDTRNTDPLGALLAYMESTRRIRRILARLERYGAHAESRQLAAINDRYVERIRLLYAQCMVSPPPYRGFPFELDGLPSPTYAPPAYGEFDHGSGE